MKYVIDAGVAVKWVIDEDHDTLARQFRDEFRNAIHELADIFLRKWGMP